MGRVTTNATGFTFAEESATLGTLPASPIWKTLEPNTISTLGTDQTTVVRNPIGVNRQRKKGTPVDLDSSLEYEADVTLDALGDFISGFLFASGSLDTLRSGALSQNLASDDVLTIVGTPPGFTHDALVAAIVEDQLVFVRGFSGSAMNGLFAVTASGSTTETGVKGAPTFVIEAPTNKANATLEIAGTRFSDLVWTDATDTISSAATDMTTMGLVVGQMLHIGGLVVGQQFGATLNALVAYGRVRSIAAGAVTLDKVTGTLKTAAADQTAAAVDVLFGSYVRNLPVGTAGDASNIATGVGNLNAFKENGFQFEVTWSNLFDGPTEDGHEYSKGNLPNQLTWSLPLADKATATFAFVGLDSEPPVRPASRKTNASDPLDPVKTAAFNTSSDFVRLRVANIDESGLTTDFKSTTITFLNNVTPEKVLGTVGAKFMNFGNFEVSIESSALFTNGDVIAAIRNNTTVSFDFIVRNADGAVAVDIPELALGGGGRDLPENETVSVALTGESFEDSIFGVSLGVTMFPTVPIPA